MANPCCPKCGNMHFAKTKSAALSAVMVYCARCGAVVGVVPTTRTTTTTSGKGGVTAGDDWEMRA